MRLAVGKQRLDLPALMQPPSRGSSGGRLGRPAPMLTAALERLDALGRIVESDLGDGHHAAARGFLGAGEARPTGVALSARRARPAGTAGGDHPFRAMAAAPAALSTALGPSDVGLVTEARAFAVARRGLHVLDGGLAALQELLLQRIETFGGERRRRSSRWA